MGWEGEAGASARCGPLIAGKSVLWFGCQVSAMDRCAVAGCELSYGDVSRSGDRQAHML